MARPGKLRGLSKNTSSSPNESAKDDELREIVAQIQGEIIAAEAEHHQLKPSLSQTLNGLKKQPAQQADVARFLFRNRHQMIVPHKEGLQWYPDRWPTFVTFTSLMRANLRLRPEELLDWIEELWMNQHRKVGQYSIPFDAWPIGFMMQQVERKSKKAPLSPKALGKLAEMAKWPEMQNVQQTGGLGVDFAKVGARIQSILHAHDDSSPAVVPYKKLSGDAFGDKILSQLDFMDVESANKRHRVFNHAATARSSKPTKTFMDVSETLKTDLGKEWLRTEIQDWLTLAARTKVVETVKQHTWQAQTQNWVEPVLFTNSNTTLLKGLVWMAEGFRDAKTINLVADLCETSMRKIPGVGPAAQAVANACLRYLELTPGGEATARLARLSTAIKQKNVQKRVADIVAKKAEAAGVTTIQLEERVVPTYGLSAGEKTVAFDDYTLRIRVEGPSRVSLTWLKPDGTPQKTKPSFITKKAVLKTKLDKAKAEVLNLKKVLSARRDHIDRYFAEDIEWPLEDVQQYYVCHDLLCVVATRLIWVLHTGGVATPALYRNGGWEDVSGHSVTYDTTTTARLWHPVDHGTDEIMAWRARIEDLGIVQPTKQAHREIYLLTDAERRTDTYSNRMAAHILKQHQMATLMLARGWRYQLMGAFDDGLDEQWAHKSFVSTDLSAEYFIRTNSDVESYNDTGIYTYVGTDQVRFVRAGVPVRLDTVPARLLSETMREADLFVGVSSVGNDPAWHDQGPTPEAYAYWQSYAFGGLDTFAATRKEILTGLLPRLKIRDKARIDGDFLYVTGALNTYKIHLRSSNILMSPGDRYLCIVPGNVSKSAPVTLPFEGDNRLSVILSKALMLAEDDKITAPDIVSQFRR